MHTFRNISLTVLISFVLTACYASGPAFTRTHAHSNNSAIIYVYRTRDLSDSEGRPKIRLGQIEKGPLLPGGYVWFEAGAPSEIQFVVPSDNWGNWLTECRSDLISIGPGQEYYLRLLSSTKVASIVGIGGVFGTDYEQECSLILMEPDIALSEILQLRGSD